MIGSLILLEGVGAVIFAAVATALGVPAAYALAGIMLAAAGLAGYSYTRAHAEVADLSRPAAADA
jgi:hypothetical protein